MYLLMNSERIGEGEECRYSGRLHDFSIIISIVKKMSMSVPPPLD